jgi:hypothetical protein
VHILLDVAQRDLAPTGVNHIQRDQLAGRHVAHGNQTVDRLWRRCRQTRHCVGSAVETAPVPPGMDDRATCDITPNTLPRRCSDLAKVSLRDGDTIRLRTTGYFLPQRWSASTSLLALHSVVQR